MKKIAGLLVALIVGLAACASPALRQDCLERRNGWIGHHRSWPDLSQFFEYIIIIISGNRALASDSGNGSQAPILWIPARLPKGAAR